jgi:hypothetical protein
MCIKIIEKTKTKKAVTQKFTRNLIPALVTLLASLIFTKSKKMTEKLDFFCFALASFDTMKTN